MQKQLARRSRSHAPTTLAAHEQARIVEHVTRHLAAPAFVIHEIESEIVHVDVNVVPPGPERDFWFLFTTGMSARPMTIPPDTGCSRFAEVSILLPADWKLDQASWRNDSRWFWPIRELMDTARLPHRHRTWLGCGHTIASANVPAYDASTELGGLLVMHARSVPEELASIQRPNSQIDLLTLWPLYPDELGYRAEHGVGALVDLLDEAGVSDIIDPQRPGALTSLVS